MSAAGNQSQKSLADLNLHANKICKKNLREKTRNQVAKITEQSVDSVTEQQFMVKMCSFPDH
jgi:hypothetical protein